MNLYRYKENSKVYVIEHLILDMHHLNCNEFAGIYAYPYKWKGDVIQHRSKDHTVCKNFIDDNFEKIAF